MIGLFIEVLKNVYLGNLNGRDNVIDVAVVNTIT
jgi:hypothetical protein